WLESQSDRVEVNSGLELDALLFERAAERGDLEAALALYQGEFLAGFQMSESVGFDHWVDRQRARLARLHRKVCGAEIDRCAAAGDIGRAIALARRWVEIEPAEDE